MWKNNVRMNTMTTNTSPASTMPATGLQLTIPTFEDLKAPIHNPPDTKPAVRAMNVIAPAAPAAKLKVAAYCRVSTDHEEQKSSLDIQRQHFITVARQHPGWEFAGIYHDVISGTKKEKRPGLKRLLGDCAAGKVNLVLTKSVSRFARNTTDLLEMVRALTAEGTDILFEENSLDTRTMGTEFLLTILASLAENESRSFSANCRWGIQRRFQDGSYRAASAPYGYDLVDGGYVVNEAEAETVRDIFSRRTEGWSLGRIADDLNSRGIPSKRAGQKWKGQEVSGKWSAAVCGRLLRNEAYIGDILLQKTYIDSGFHLRANRGEYPQYYHEGHHPAIISREMWEQVQETFRAGYRKQCGKNRHFLTGMLRCSECGSVMYHSRNRSGNSSWTCRKHKDNKDACGMKPVGQDEVINAFTTLVRRLAEDNAEIRLYEEAIRSETMRENKGRITSLAGRLEEIGRELKELQDSRRRGAVSTPEFLSRKNALNKERTDIQQELEKMTDRRIHETEELLKAITGMGGSFVFDEGTFLELVDTVLVHGRGRFAFRFRCGLEAEERSGPCS